VVAEIEQIRKKTMASAYLSSLEESFHKRQHRMIIPLNPPMISYDLYYEHQRDEKRHEEKGL